MQESHFWIKVFLYFGINLLNHKMYTCFLKKRKVCDRIMILETRTLHLGCRTCLSRYNFFFPEIACVVLVHVPMPIPVSVLLRL